MRTISQPLPARLRSPASSLQMLPQVQASPSASQLTPQPTQLRTFPGPRPDAHGPEVATGPLLDQHGFSGWNALLGFLGTRKAAGTQVDRVAGPEKDRVEAEASIQPHATPSA